jgi:ketosteroid isomerase-like protein
MSQENVEIASRAIAALSELGEPAWDLYAPDLVFRTRGDFGDAQTFHGHDGLARALDGFREVWGDDIKADLLEVLGSGDACVVVLRFRLRGVQSGVDIEVDESWAMWLVDGRISRMEQYGATPEALKAVGLVE